MVMSVFQIVAVLIWLPAPPLPSVKSIYPLCANFWKLIMYLYITHNQNRFFECTQVLAFKIYRHMCGKLSALLFSVLTVVLDSMDPASPMMKRATRECQLLASQNSSGSISLNGSGSSSTSLTGSQPLSISNQNSVNSIGSNSSSNLSLSSSYNSSTSSIGSADGDDSPVSTGYGSAPLASPMSTVGECLPCIDAGGLKPIAMAALTQESSKLRGLKKKLSKSKRLSATFSTAPYKSNHYFPACLVANISLVYNLENNSHGSVTVQVDNKKITIVSASVGFKTKVCWIYAKSETVINAFLQKKIKLSKIMDVARTTNISVTIIFDMQAVSVIILLQVSYLMIYRELYFSNKPKSSPSSAESCSPSFKTRPNPSLKPTPFSLLYLPPQTSVPSKRPTKNTSTTSPQSKSCTREILLLPKEICTREFTSLQRARSIWVRMGDCYSTYLTAIFLGM